MVNYPEKGCASISINQVFSYLLSGRGSIKTMFYSRILSQLKKYEEPGLGTMAVTIRDGGYALLYDPEMFDGRYTLDQLSVIVMHEALHLALMHIPRYARFLNTAQSELQRKAYRAMSNIAMDYAVNSLIIYSGEYSSDQMAELRALNPRDAGLSPYKSMDYYLLELSKNAEEVAAKLVASGLVEKSALEEPAPDGESGAPQREAGTLEVLEAYANSSATGATEDIQEELQKVAGSTTASLEDLGDDLTRESERMVRSELSSAKARGVLPGRILAALDSLLEAPTLGWEKLLRKHISTTRRWKKKRSALRRKRRVPIDDLNPWDEACEYPGKKKDPAYTIVFAIDTSASMSDADVADCLSELAGVQRSDSGVKITVIEADTRIQREYTIGHHDPLKRDRAGCGGTRFDDVFIRYKELTADLLIYATDGEAPLPAPTNRVPEKEVLWLVTRNGCYPGNYSWSYQMNKETYGKAIFIK